MSEARILSLGGDRGPLPHTHTPGRVVHHSAACVAVEENSARAAVFRSLLIPPDANNSHSASSSNHPGCASSDPRSWKGPASSVKLSRWLSLANLLDRVRPTFRWTHVRGCVLWAGKSTRSLFIWVELKEKTWTECGTCLCPLARALTHRFVWVLTQDGKFGFFQFKLVCLFWQVVGSSLTFVTRRLP